VLAQIQSHALLIFRDSESHGCFQNRQNNGGYPHRKNDRRDDTHKLNPKLVRVAEKEPIIPCCVNGLGSKEPGGQCTPRAADTVNANHIKGVVVTKLGLHIASRIAKNPANSADDERGNRTDKSRGRSDRDETRYGTARRP
jgi:hypothetical protein